MMRRKILKKSTLNFSNLCDNNFFKKIFFNKINLYNTAVPYEWDFLKHSNKFTSIKKYLSKIKKMKLKKPIKKDINYNYFFFKLLNKLKILLFFKNKLINKRIVLNNKQWFNPIWINNFFHLNNEMFIFKKNELRIKNLITFKNNYNFVTFNYKNKIKHNYDVNFTLLPNFKINLKPIQTIDKLNLINSNINFNDKIDQDLISAVYYKNQIIYKNDITIFINSFNEIYREITTLNKIIKNKQIKFKYFLNYCNFLKKKKTLKIIFTNQVHLNIKFTYVEINQ